MEMQDKEFDKLFSARLDSFEVEPSKNVWARINNELGGREYRKLIPLLSIAASIIVLIGAALLFIPKGGKMTKPAKHQVAVTHPVKGIPPVTKNSPVTEAPKTTVIASATNNKLPLHEKNKVSAQMYQVKTAVAQPVPAAVQQQPVLAAAQASKNDIAVQQAIDTTTAIAAVPVVKTDKPATLIAVVPDKDKPADIAPVKKHRIRSFGDVLNVVIAAVDKRKDKVIEFSNTDGDEASITGVNLGIIKIKKEN